MTGFAAFFHNWTPFLWTSTARLLLSSSLICGIFADNQYTVRMGRHTGNNKGLFCIHLIVSGYHFHHLSRKRHCPTLLFLCRLFGGKTTLFSSRLSRPLQLFSSSQKSCSDSLWSLLSRPNIPNLHAHDIKLAPFFTQRLVSKGRTGRTDTIAQTLIQP